MAVTFLEPGGDATFNTNLTSNGGFWSDVAGGGEGVASDIVHGAHQRSIVYGAGGDLATPQGILSDAGGRISFWLYYETAPSSTAMFALVKKVGGNVFTLALSSSGVVQLYSGALTAQLGSNGPTLSTGNWYRVVISYTITSTTVNRFEIKVFSSDGTTSVGTISVTNGTLATTGTSYLYWGNISGNANFRIRTSDHYVDNSNALNDPGNIWVTAKRPISNGTAVELTTQIGSGGSGVGTGHAPQVNERALSTTNGWSLSNTTKKTEEYSIEAASAGDIDISGSTIVDYMGWIYAQINSASNSPVHHIIVGGVATTKTMSVSASMFTQIAGSSTYPAGNTDIGIDAQYTTTPHLTSLFECGIMIAYIGAVSITVSQGTPPSVVASIPSYTITTTQSVTISQGAPPSVVASIPTYTITAIRNVTVSSSVLTATFSVQSATELIHESYSPPQPFTAVFSIPTYTAYANDIVVAGTVQSAVFSVPSRTIITSVSLAPAVQSAVFTIPSYSIALLQLVSPSVVSATFSIPTYAVKIDVSISPAVKSSTFSIPTYSEIVAVVASPSVQSAIFSIPTYTPISSVSLSPSVQSATFSIPVYTITAIKNVTISPVVQAMTFGIPSYTITTTRFITINMLPVSLLFSIPRYQIAADYWQDHFDNHPPTSWSDKNPPPSTSWSDHY